METTLLTLLGGTMLYSWIHFIVLSINKEYKKRTTYEKVVTWYAVIGFILFVLGSI